MSQTEWSDLGMTELLPTGMVTLLLADVERKRPSKGWASLTPTELDVVRLACDGLGNKAIGARLFVSPRTVQAHLSPVYSKLGIRHS